MIQGVSLLGIWTSLTARPLPRPGSTISNPDGTVSIVHVDPNNPVITLPDGTQAQVTTFRMILCCWLLVQCVEML